MDLNTLEQSITALLDKLNALQFHDRDRATLYHLFKLDFNQVNRTTFFTERGWTCNSRCLSGNSLVLKVATDSEGTQRVVKFVNPSVCLNLEHRKQEALGCMHLLHYEACLQGPLSKQYVLTYTCCLSPLTEVQANRCLHNFVAKLINALEAVRVIPYQMSRSCDTRLPILLQFPIYVDLVIKVTCTIY